MSLRQHLESLHWEDGRPDVQRRKAELESLFQALTSSEIRHFRSQLNAKTFQKDICGSLPLELLLRVSQHLELEDLQRVLSVSRRWNEIFSSPEFHIGIVKLHFTSIWETSYKGLDPKKQSVRKQALHEWLPGAAMRRIRRTHGCYNSTSTYQYSWNGQDVPLRDRAEKPQYCNGRISYQVERGIIVVRNLRTGFAMTFTDENRALTPTYLLSDQLIIAQISSPACLEIEWKSDCADFGRAILLAWPLDAQEGSEPHSIRLPAMARHISAQRKQVGIVTNSDEVLIWKVGGGLQSIITSNAAAELTELTKRPLAVAFHPDDEQSYFVVYTALNAVPPTNDKWRTTIVVQHCRKGTTDAFHIFHLVHSQLDLYYRHRFVSLEDGHIGIVMPHEVFFYEQETKEHSITSLPSPHPCKHQRNNPTEGDNDKLKLLLMVRFDTRRNTFSTESYHLSRDLQEYLWIDLHRYFSINQLHIWRDQTSVPMYKVASPPAKSGRPINQILVVGMNKCSEKQTPNPIPVYGRLGPEYTHMPRTWDDSWLSECGVAFAWMRGTGFTEGSSEILTHLNRPLQPFSHLKPRSMSGDDDFVVLFSGAGYTVWCFDKDVSLPMTAS